MPLRRRRPGPKPDGPEISFADQNDVVCGIALPEQLYEAHPPQGLAWELARIIVLQALADLRRLEQLRGGGEPVDDSDGWVADDGEDALRWFAESNGEPGGLLWCAQALRETPDRVRARALEGGGYFAKLRRRIDWHLRDERRPLAQFWPSSLRRSPARGRGW